MLRHMLHAGRSESVQSTLSSRTLTYHSYRQYISRGASSRGPSRRRPRGDSDSQRESGCSPSNPPRQSGTCCPGTIQRHPTCRFFCPPLKNFTSESAVCDVVAGPGAAMSASSACLQRGMRVSISPIGARSSKPGLATARRATVRMPPALARQSLAPLPILLCNFRLLQPRILWPSSHVKPVKLAARSPCRQSKARASSISGCGSKRSGNQG